MKKLIKNNKGITLVELIVAVAIFSIVALMMVVGFTTASNIILRSKEINNSSIELSQELEQKSLSPLLDSESKPYSITILDKKVDGYFIEKKDGNVSYKAFVPWP